MKNFLIAILFTTNMLIVYADSVNKIEISKFNDNYFINMKSQNQNFKCVVDYRKLENGQYNRELRCAVVTGNDNRTYLRDTVKFPTETWENFDKLFYNMYGEYTLWHNSPTSLVKDSKELAKAKSKYVSIPCQEKNGVYHYDVVKGSSSCSYKVDYIKDMTKEEKEDYFRAKDFEAEYENYKKYKGY